ncbi:MAG TPA: Rieske 2Fe-2S domain-containing protein, partial [bacterium]|nr:Rieske 2Fe-2S domain-containing protein [bacterium]
MESFRIETEIARAETLPGRAYGDPAVWERSRERVFARSWQYLPAARDLPAGDGAAPLTLLEGCLDEPLVLTRHRGRVRCLSNVCTHRAAVVVGDARECNHLRCPYHGRRFRLDGTLEHMPEFQEV